MDKQTFSRARILICDDNTANVRLLEGLLATSGYQDVTGTTEPARLLAECAESPPDLILLDLHMPEIDGFELMTLLRPALAEPWLPVVVLSGDTTPEAKQRALSTGARDFLTKPIDAAEALLRIENLLETRFLHAELQDRNKTLESMVEHRTRDLQESRLEAVQRLALAAEYRDDITGEHAQRVGRTAALVSRALSRPAPEVEVIRQAATLHDVGKIGVPDAVLLKPGRLTRDEYEAMKAHVEVGARILSCSRSALLRMSEQIVLGHHEKWDGSGYPVGLSGSDIPLPARVTAIADVFDALAHNRPYKPAWPLDAALAELRAQRARQFDPEVVDAFLTLDHALLLMPVEWSTAPPPASARVESADVV